MMGQMRWVVAAVVCSLFTCQTTAISPEDPGQMAAARHSAKTIDSCAQVCQGVKVENGCQYAPTDSPREEVIVVTNGDSDIALWQWDTPITMVVATHLASLTATGRSACITHSKGKRFGLRELVPDDFTSMIRDVDSMKTNFSNRVKRYQQLLMADHMVFDLVDFFISLKKNVPVDQQSLVLSKMTEVLADAAATVKGLHDSDVYCIAPWQPPCDTNCSDVKALLGQCDVLILSPDSYTPIAPESKQCVAQTTVPLAQYLYGINRYLELRSHPNMRRGIVSGVPWHGFAYNCQLDKETDRCVVTKEAGSKCFDQSNRQRMSLGHIHSEMNIPDAKVKMDIINKGIYYNLNDSAQLWYENYTTLYLKYQLVKDFSLRGVSIWYGEDLLYGMSVDKEKFTIHNWDFLMHNILHKATYEPTKINHHFANTVAGVGVGCLLLGTILGVVFTCIAFRKYDPRTRNRPFKLDETDDDFRDDEGL